MKNKKLLLAILIYIFFIPLMSWAADPAPAPAPGPFSYTPLEKIPGSDDVPMTDFYVYINAVYKFGIWAVGIAALLMIAIGGYMYITSAGNNTSMEKAKGVVTDAIVGLVLALTAYLLLYVINPDLVKISTLPAVPAPTTPAGPAVGPKAPTKTCLPVTAGDCSVSNLQSTCLASNAEKMSRLCGYESDGGNPVKISLTDKCQDGTSFSIGLFQINMITSAGSIGCNGKDIFDVNGDNSGTCLQETTNSNGLTYCAVRDCAVKDMTKYNECLEKLKNPQTNITAACALSNNGSSLAPWVNTAQICGL